MEALVPAFIAVFLAEFGGIGQRSAVAMHRQGKSLIVPLALLVLAMASAAVGGLLVAPYMPLAARGLMVGLSLVAAAIPLFVPSHRKPASASIGRYISALLGAGGPFIIFALTTWTGMAVLAGVGGILGGVAVVLPHILSETPLREKMPIGTVRRASGGILLAAGLFTALASLGLI